MLSMEELGYFLYMEQCDKEQELKEKESAAALGKYKVESEELLEAERATHTENLRRL